MLLCCTMFVCGGHVQKMLSIHAAGKGVINNLSFPLDSIDSEVGGTTYSFVLLVNVSTFQKLIVYQHYCAIWLVGHLEEFFAI